MSRPLRIMLSAGEASGDRLGAGLAEALRRRHADIDLIGMGGEKMAAAGVRLLQNSSEVAVVGIWEVLRHLPAIRRAKGLLEDAIRSEKPDLLVPIDFPDFNLRLAAGAKKEGVPVVYFVSPQIWAWRRGRVRKIRSLVRRMMVLFPFESEFYEAAGVPVTYVGHPVVDRAESGMNAERLRERAGLDPEGQVIALVPGSRREEVERLLPPMLGAAERLRRTRPGLQFLLPLAPGLPRDLVEQIVSRHDCGRIQLHSGDFPDILSLCSAGVVASGTASLEAAAVGLPMVVVYRISPLSYAIGRALIRVDNIALPNLVAGRRVVPELIQGRCNAGAIAEALARYLDDPAEVDRVRRDLDAVRRKLGGPGIFDRAADALLAEVSPAL
jgi:lipid-A-disaccharide synthase